MAQNDEEKETEIAMKNYEPCGSYTHKSNNKTRSCTKNSNSNSNNNDNNNKYEGNC